MEHENILQEVDDSLDRAIQSLNILVKHYKEKKKAEQVLRLKQAEVEYETARAVIIESTKGGWLANASDENVLLVKELADKWANTPIPGTENYVDPLAKTVSLAANNEAVKRGLIDDPAEKAKQEKTKPAAKENPERVTKEKAKPKASDRPEDSKLMGTKARQARVNRGFSKAGFKSFFSNASSSFISGKHAAGKSAATTRLANAAKSASSAFARVRIR